MSGKDKLYEECVANKENRDSKAKDAEEKRKNEEAESKKNQL